ncbi:hypothetical protein B0T26DRAFT_174055 [Lasiosphaeria miniovina]|uniref:LIM zinc-binding domain-containing protein n=1 Tax=Lasiosphaeria miniovina TaxID=1954250 RepID=A0AA40B6I3_9PEZI|nr:uncharacterized protein B0T26DRAFT_174055 [Lasiosphaeria miniovina]KAK0728492.1 hypothetical protein B0T26DRAFT_174055 [Lasiosphaeria miniovina]
MAGAVRESSFMPTVKCSDCGLQIEISLMGEHICSGKPSTQPTPPMPIPSLFERFMPFGGPAANNKQSRTPPQVDTSAANRAFMGQGELTPVSMSSGSRSVSPKTPNGRLGAGRADEDFAPRIADDSPLPQQSRRPGGYGGLGDGDGYEDSLYPTNVAKKQASSLMDRANTIAPGPFDSGRRPPLSGRTASAGDIWSERQGPSPNLSSSVGSLGSSKTPKAPRKNGYGGFGPPQREELTPEPLGLPSRSATFPRSGDTLDPPMRTPSAPGPRPDRLRVPSDDSQDMDGRFLMTSERSRRPSRGPDTSRPPPPRSAGIVRSSTPGALAINLAEEFGSGNPYHAPSDSSSSSASGFSQPERRPSEASSRSSPPRSASSKWGRNPSDTSGLDNIMSDLQSSMVEPDIRVQVVSPPTRSASDTRGRPPPLTIRPPGGRGYDRRYDPRIDPRNRQGVSPIDSPVVDTPSTADPPSAVDAPMLIVGDDFSPLPTAPPRLTRSPEPMQDRSRFAPQGPLRSRSRDPSQPSRGACESCKEPIVGKSISSADGRLTGRYHKACFVCTDCRQSFPSSTFYVIENKPYCERDYHERNDSLCTTCDKGIEGQYLEDESAKKHHVGCFRCRECGMALNNAYFEVDKKAYCEKDAMKLVQPPTLTNIAPPPRNGQGPPRPMLGLPGGPRAGIGLPGRSPLGPRPRMEKRMTRLGMM